MSKQTITFFFFALFISKIYAQSKSFIIKVDQKKTTETLDELSKLTGIQNITSCSNFKKKQKESKKKFKSTINHYYKIEIMSGHGIDNIKSLASKCPGVNNIIILPTSYLLEAPNDVDTSTSHHDGGQYFYLHHTFKKAWEIEKGNPNIKIGIVDTGTRLSHNDLKTKIAYNYDDPIDNINNDNDFAIKNGVEQPLTDNYQGWDLADWDNDVSPVLVNDHGTQVAGIAAGATNNNTGGVSAGYNSTFIPYKVAPDNYPESITVGYEGIIMAAEQGCSVINASWGIPETYLSTSTIEYMQSVIDYVTLDLDVLVVAAAGSATSGEASDWIPASLEHVLSVTMVTPTFRKTNRAAFNNNVDLCAQGWNNVTTYAENDSSYSPFMGTSSAAPVVSGAAALLRAHFPSWSALQISEQLIRTGDVVDTLPDNILFKGQMGKYLNPYNALIDTLPQVRVQGIDISSEGPFKKGDHLETSITFINKKKTSKDIQVSINSTAPTVLVNNDFSLFSFDHLEIKQHDSFQFTLDQTTPDSTLIELQISYTDGFSYNEAELVRFYVETPIISSIAFLDNKTQKEAFIVHPINDQLVIHLNNETPTEYCIYNILGNPIKRGIIKNDERVIKLNDINSVLKSGLYILELKHPKAQFKPLKFTIP